LFKNFKLIYPFALLFRTYGEASKNPEIKEQAAKLNVKIKEVKSMPLRNAKGSNPYYANVMVKLRIFQLFEYDRIIFMDSDMMIRQNLDHLFYTLPKDVHLAASRVTDTQKIDSRVFCSCFIVLTPTTKIWDRIMAYYKQNDGGYLKENLLDMDLLNKEFGSDVILLPGTYAMLTSIWEDKMDQRSPQETNEMYQQLVGKPTNVTTKDAIYEEAKVLHFTPNKPMVEKKLENIKQHKPRAYPQYYRTFEEYFSLSRYVCPFIRDSPSINNK
jgi:alpha-N-acetylglucosamine transferase